ncbi:MAG: ABC transporter permease [Candidatus Obscuribacterales bacterium]|jgi:ABC-2 type transport system permease protein|nr:ABC transporter permease [Candidatus Obscuribacterales bacterium]
MRLAAQAVKEWSEFKRDRLSLALAFLLPLFSLLLFGYGIRLESKNIPIVIEDHDNTSLSREYVHRLYATNVFRKAEDSNAKSIKEALDKGEAKAALLIPAGFTAQIFKGTPSQPQVYIDGTDIANTQIISNTITAANRYFIAMLKTVKNPDVYPQKVKAHLRTWFNPGREESLFIVPGAFGIILWMYPALLAAVAASRDKEQGTIIRVYSSGISAAEFLLGKTLVYFLISLGLAAIVIGSGCFLFQVMPTGDPLPLLIATPLYVLTSVLFGILLGTYANSQTTAVQATSSLGFFPCLLLSGFVYPISNIPFPLSLFSIIVPSRYFIDLCRDTFVRGTGWLSVWQIPFILLLFILSYFLFTLYGTRQMQLKS